MANKYNFFLKTTFQQNISDPSKFYSFFIGHLAIIVVYLILWRAIFNINPNFRGYTFEKMITYYILGSFLSKLTLTGNSAKIIAQNIKSGDFSNYMIKPVNYNLATFIKTLVERVVQSASAIFVFLVITYFLNFQFFNIKSIILFGISLVLGVVLNHFIYSSLGTLAFITIDIKGIRSIFGRIADLASGKLFPLDILPVNFLNIFKLLPFSYMHYLPMSIYLLKIDSSTAISQIMIQASWIIIFILLYNLLFNLGIKRYESIGI